MNIIPSRTVWVRIIFNIHQYCHNPTNNPKQLKTTFVGVAILSVRKNHHHTITTRVSLHLKQFQAT
jgi:hypothetical protein